MITSFQFLLLCVKHYKDVFVHIILSILKICRIKTFFAELTYKKYFFAKNAVASFKKVHVFNKSICLLVVIIAQNMTLCTNVHDLL